MMKDNESPLNIFHQTAKKESAEDSQKPLSTSHNVSRQIQRSNNLMLEMHDMQSKIEEELEKLMHVSGLSKAEVWQLLERAHNFVPDKWEQAQERYKELKEKITTSLVIDLSEANVMENRVANKDQARKAKFTGARRNWLSTR